MPKRLVTGTNADLRKLPLKEAKEICRDYGVREEEARAMYCYFKLQLKSRIFLLNFSSTVLCVFFDLRSYYAFVIVTKNAFLIPAVLFILFIINFDDL